MTAADLHGDDDEFGNDPELAREGGVYVWVTERETDGAVGRDDLEEDREECEGILVRVRQMVPFDNADNEKAESNIPQIKSELTPQMSADIAWLFAVFIIVIAGCAVDAQGFLFVDVGPTNGYGDREDGNVHHDHIRDLNGRV